MYPKHTTQLIVKLARMDLMNHLVELIESDCSFDDLKKEIYSLKDKVMEIKK